jgi:dUTP pyrophosphatase
MNAHIIENPVPNTEAETLEALLNFMGTFGGGDTEEFQQVKEIIKENGITSEQIWNLMTDNAIEEILGRRIISVKAQRLTDTAQIPVYSHLGDACADIYADEDVTIEPGETHLVSTGIALAIPQGFVVHIYPRSGLSANTKLRLANSVGVIDAGYRDEIKVPIWNSGDIPYHIERGMRIAQMDIMDSPAIEFEEIDDIKEISGDRLGGFGSSGLFDMLNSDDPLDREKLVAEIEKFNGKV